MSLPPLQSLTLQQITQGLDDGAFTIVELVQAHLDRIMALNPVLNAVIETNPSAVPIAQSLDQELKRSGRRSMLYGVPVLVKENVVTSEKLNAAAGSLALVGAKPARESLVATKLRDAGAVILGTSNMSEWSNFRSRPSDDGWSARRGQTHGAYHDKQDPGGSSSGSALGVDMALTVLAIGTETSGSIISPSNENNVVGIKPTTGLVSRVSVVPISQEQDTVGPIARTVKDAAAILTVISGRDDRDEKTRRIPFQDIPDYTKACDQTNLSGMRMGIPRTLLSKVQVPAILKKFDELVDSIRPQVAEIVDFDFAGCEKFDALSSVQKTDAIAGDFHHAMEGYLATLSTNPNKIHNVHDICEYIKTTPGEEYDRRNIDRLEQAVDRTADSDEYRVGKWRREYFAGEGGIKGALETYHLDAIIAPTMAYTMNYFSACGGFPQITVPLGYLPMDVEVQHNETGNLVTEGPNIPFGVSVVGDRFSEEKLLGVCQAIETISRTRDTADTHRLQHIR